MKKAIAIIVLSLMWCNVGFANRLGIEAKKLDSYWECFTDCGRIQSSKNVLDWVLEVEQRGAGEILLQSVDSDGKQKGFDIE